MKVKQKIKRIVAIVVVIALMLGMIPLRLRKTENTVSAEVPEYCTVTAGEKSISLYGSAVVPNVIEQEACYLIEIANSGSMYVYVDEVLQENAISDLHVMPDEDGISVYKDWLQGITGSIAISVGEPIEFTENTDVNVKILEDSTETEEAVGEFLDDEGIIFEESEDLHIEVYAGGSTGEPLVKCENLEYDGEEQPLLEWAADIEDSEKEKYSFEVDGIAISTRGDIPRKTDSGIYNIVVKKWSDDTTPELDESGNQFEWNYSVEIAKATLDPDDFEVVGYDDDVPVASVCPAVSVKEKGNDLNASDTIEYRKKDAGEDFSETKMVSQQEDSGIYEVRITRSNYEPLIISFEVFVGYEILEGLQLVSDQTVYYYGSSNTVSLNLNGKKDTSDVTYSLVSTPSGIATVNSSTGVVTFSNIGSITVKATVAQDDVGRYKKAEAECSFEVAYKTINNTCTLSACDYETPSYKWYKQQVTITAPTGWKIKNANSIPSVNETGFSDSITVSDAGIYDNYQVSYYDTVSGFITPPQKVDSFAIDKGKPGDVSVELRDVNAGTVQNIINKLSFGTFFNRSVSVEVTAKDYLDEGSNADGAGIKTISLYKCDEADNETAVTAYSNNYAEGKALFTIEVGFKGTLKVEVVDQLGNTTGKILVNKENSNIGDNNVTGFIMLEEEDPEISDIKKTPLNNGVTDGDEVFNGDVEFKVSVKDAQSGLNKVEIYINDTICIGYPKDFADKENDEQVYTVDTSGIDAKSDGEYAVTVKVYDNAGNLSVKSTAVQVDETAATIKGFEFDVTSFIDVTSNMGGLYEAVEATDYGFYFKKDVAVTVYAEDIKSDKEYASGVKSISYRVIDIDGTVVETKDDVAVGSNGSISFIVKKEFKGQIYALATDKVGNNPANKKLPEKYNNKLPMASGELKGFVHPNRAVVESEQKHAETSAIAFKMPKSDGTQSTLYTYKYSGDALKDKVMDYNTEQQVPLYRSDFNMGIDITDSYSGIRSVKYTLIEGEEKTTHSITIDNDGSLTGDVTGWLAGKEEGSNLVTSLKNNNIEVSGNYNNMVMLVELTDRVGNKSYDYVAFGIDKTNPAIKISYSNNNGDKKSKSAYTFFQKERTATISITERNFTPENFVVKVTKNGKTQKLNLKWDYKSGSGNKDNTVYKTKIKYDKDGYYTFSIKGKDRAGNVNKKVEYGRSMAPNKFAIDTTKPTIQVSYDNNSAQNGKYFKEYRTATVAVKEKNFDVNRVKFTQTASLEGASIAVPSASWSHNGDTHIATIVYNTDGDYTFDVTMDDMAGNVCTADYGSSVAGTDFVIDTSIEKPVIKGVENGVAYKGDVIPDIMVDDVNYENSEIVLTRTRLNEKNVDVTKDYLNELKQSTRGVTGISDTFKKIRENDGIYTLSITMSDMAGNMESDEVVFTVNRFGSVYEYSDYLSSLADEDGTYVQAVEQNLVITEYNPDKLIEDTLAIEITRDGRPLDNVQYEVSPVINDKVDVGDSGWYQYEYVIDSTNFAGDGVYKVAVSTKDEAGNASENTNYQDMAIGFFVDSTAPELTSVKGLENRIVNAQELDVKFNVFDALGLKSVEVYVDDTLLNGTVTDFADDLNNYAGSFKLNEKNASQGIRIVVEDLAGNITDTASDGFTSAYTLEDRVTVSTNWFVRWFANKLVFFGSIGGAIVLVGGVWFGIAALKKRKL